MSAESFESRRGAFLESLRVRGLSPATVRTRAQAIDGFARWLASEGIEDVREVARETIQAYRQWLLSRSYTPHTLHAKLIGVSRFFEHLEMVGALLINPCTGLRLPPLGDRLPLGVLTREEARRILDAPDVKTLAGLRDKAILEVFYSTGLRLAELARLTVFDVDLRHGFVRVNNGKGGQDRVVPLGAKAVECVREYLAQARAHWIHGESRPHLWLGSIAPHGALKAQAIQAMVRHYGRAAGVPVTPHLWRHTCATHLVANGANLASVQRLLGHRSLRTTQRYARVAANEVRAMHAKSHPRARQAASAADPNAITARR